jgi:hypothetical protein
MESNPAEVVGIGPLLLVSDSRGGTPTPRQIGHLLDPSVSHYKK